DSIGSRWYTFVDQKRDLINIGTLRMDFVVDRSGRVKNLKVTENSSNAAFASVCVQSVLEAHLPPLRRAGAKSLPAEGLSVEGVGIIIFPNGCSSRGSLPKRRESWMSCSDFSREAVFSCGRCWPARLCQSRS